MSTHIASGPRSIFQLVLRILTAGSLLVSAYVHLHLASTYDPIKGAHNLLTQGDLFRVQAGGAALVAVLLLFWDRTLAWLAAGALGLGSLAAVVTYRYVDIGALGPIPDMYEPVWSHLKAISAVAEGAAALLVLLHFASRGAHGHRRR